MSESSGKRDRPDAQTESVKKDGDNLVPDLPQKQVGANDAELVQGGFKYDIKGNKEG